MIESELNIEHPFSPENNNNIDDVDDDGSSAETKNIDRQQQGDDDHDNHVINKNYNKVSVNSKSSTPANHHHKHKSFSKLISEKHTNQGSFDHHLRHHQQPQIQPTTMKMIVSNIPTINIINHQQHQVPDEIMSLPNADVDNDEDENDKNINSIASLSNFDSLDVDSFIPQGYDKLMPPKENGKENQLVYEQNTLNIYLNNKEK